jgi:hypothetical protein
MTTLAAVMSVGYAALLYQISFFSRHSIKYTVDVSEQWNRYNKVFWHAMIVLSLHLIWMILLVGQAWNWNYVGGASGPWSAGVPWQWQYTVIFPTVIYVGIMALTTLGLLWNLWQPGKGFHPDTTWKLLPGVSMAEAFAVLALVVIVYASTQNAQSVTAALA